MRLRQVTYNAISNEARMLSAPVDIHEGETNHLLVVKGFRLRRFKSRR